jgi:hypothetical protein
LKGTLIGVRLQRSIAKQNAPVTRPGNTGHSRDRAKGEASRLIASVESGGVTTTDVVIMADGLDWKLDEDRNTSP